MTDHKSTPKRGRARRTSAPQFSNIQENKMVYRTSWNYGSLTSSTDGILSAADISPSIENSSEYTILQSLFGEVKLLRCTVRFTLSNSADATMSRAYVGTAMQATKSTHATTPLGYNDVQNLARVKLIPCGGNTSRTVSYRMVVPRNLDYTLLTNDSPTVATPYAGSPGCVYIYADTLTPSRRYYTIDVECVYLLRGRI